MAADALKYLYALRRILDNRGTEQQQYSQYYSLAKKFEHLIIPFK